MLKYLDMKKFVIKSILWVVGISIGYGLYQMGVRQWPRKLPTQPVALRSAVQDILTQKCAVCHDTERDYPLLSKIPLLGDLISENHRQATRHWKPFDRSYLGPSATEGQRIDAPTPLTVFTKLSHALSENLMPPREHLILCWGSWISPSEKQILNEWIKSQRGEWLSQWGITNGMEFPIQPIPTSIPHNEAKAALGEKLFYDKRLSSDGAMSCATCHDLQKGGDDAQRLSVGDGGQSTVVNTPTVLNAVFNIRQFWDGRAADLAEQAHQQLTSPDAMGVTNWTAVAERLASDASFKTNFLAVYPLGFTEKNICSAIAEYEKRLITPGSRFDQYLQGKKGVLSTEENKGYLTFRKFACASCHNGPSMGGQSFEYADLKDNYFKGRVLNACDKGLMNFSQVPRDDKSFKVPTLRNVEMSEPYFHDGSKTTLEDAVAAMLTYQVGKPYTDEDIHQITTFLKTLTGNLFGKPLQK